MKRGEIMKTIWNIPRGSSREYYNIPLKILKTPTLNYYFKGVYVNIFLHQVLINSRYKLGLPVYK